MVKSLPGGKGLLLGALSVLLTLLLACSTAATSTPEGPAATAEPSAPTAIPQATEAPAGGIVSAKDKAIGVVGTEPERLFWMTTSDAHTTQITEQLTYHVGHLDKDTLQVTPSHMLTSWEQTGPAEWVYNLRPGVTFQDGEEWNAEAWKTMAEFSGVPEYGVGAFAHTGPYSVEAIDDLTARIVCGEACPLFDRGLNVTQTQPPKTLREQEFTDITIGNGTGPFELDRWDRGSKVVLTAFDGYVVTPDSPEHAGPYLNEIEFQWRAENPVRTAMIEAGEADWAFLLGVEDAGRLGADRFVSGGTAEIAQFRIDTIWDPWLKIKEMRQAVVHSIDCESIVETIYEGATTCRGNHGAPGVLGITAENIKPYEYNPAMSRQLLEEIGYICGLPNSREDCEAEINITSRAARIAKNDELVESMVSFMQEAGINGTADFVEPSIRTSMAICGIGLADSGATQVGWQGATEATKPACDGGVGVGQILDGIGFGYEIMDYAKFINRHLLCEAARSTVCVPEKEDEWRTARTLAGEERQAALQAVADWQRENVYILPMFDLFAIYGINPKLKGFEEPRFDKHTFAGQWWFEE